MTHAVAEMRTLNKKKIGSPRKFNLCSLPCVPSYLLLAVETLFFSGTRRDRQAYNTDTFFVLLFSNIFLNNMAIYSIGGANK